MRRTYSGRLRRVHRCSPRRRPNRSLRIPRAKMKRRLPSWKRSKPCWRPAPSRLPEPPTGSGCFALCRVNRWPLGPMIARRHWTYPSRILRGLDCCARSRMRRGRRKLVGKMRGWNSQRSRCRKCSRLQRKRGRASWMHSGRCGPNCCHQRRIGPSIAQRLGPYFGWGQLGRFFGS